MRNVLGCVFCRKVREGAGKADAAAVGKFEANEAAVFGQMDLFAKRCRKLIELFTIIHQFSELAKVRPDFCCAFSCEGQVLGDK